MAKSKPRLTLTASDPDWVPRPPPENGCLYITGDVRTGSWSWCGKPRRLRQNGCRSPYCTRHEAVCYRPQEKKIS